MHFFELSMRCYTVLFEFDVRVNSPKKNIVEMYEFLIYYISM